MLALASAGCAALLVGLLLWTCAPTGRVPAPVLQGARPSASAPARVRAAYFYHYMDFDHIDSLAAAGFNRALIKWTVDSLEAGGDRARTWFERGEHAGVEVTPVWTAQAVRRLEVLPTTRRYTWGDNVVENQIGCPLDSLFWRSALLDRAEEFCIAAPHVQRLAIDLEIYFGGPGHYDAGPCRCRACLAEFDAQRGPITEPKTARSGKLIDYQRARLEWLFTRLLAEFAARHPGLELGAFDLDFDSFVHTAMGRALVSTGIPTVNYSEKTYALGAQALANVRARMRDDGIEAPIVGGLWLKRFDPAALAVAAGGLLDQTDGYFVFTTYSLWKPQSELNGGYTLPAEQALYWEALRRLNR